MTKLLGRKSGIGRVIKQVGNRQVSVVIQGDQKVSVHLITVKKVTRNIQNVPLQYSDNY
jgi:hypothetical protein